MNHWALCKIICLILTVAILGGCEENTNLPTTSMRIGSKTYTLEIADTDSTRQRGLMYRESMPADHGMIFVWAEEAKRAFWMKNTLIPLDVIYIAASGEVVSIHPLEPKETRAVPAEGPTRWAIELNRGEAAKTGIKPRDILLIPKAARED